jgi:dipeptidyl aminopeptidase/acylaminoacyl peptidase
MQRIDTHVAHRGWLLPWLSVVLVTAAIWSGLAVPAAAAGTAARNLIVFQTVSGGAIYVINADGTGLRLLTNGMDPALSPDGRQVAFTRWDNPQMGALGSLWVINVDGTGERLVLEGAHQPKAPTWSPDGTRIIINMQQGGRTEVVDRCRSLKPGKRPKLPQGAYDIHTQQEKDGDLEMCFKLPPHPEWGLRLVDVTSGAFEDLPRDFFSYSPSWDPADPNLAVYGGDNGLVGLDLAQGTTWTVTDDPCDHSPVFSPDGSRLAVTYFQNDHWEIHVMNADGSGRVRLTETPLTAIADQRLAGQEPRTWNNAAPVWSPDGQSIAFLSDRSGPYEIWVMAADGSNPRPLFDPAALQGIDLQYNGMDERAFSWR